MSVEQAVPVVGATVAEQAIRHLSRLVRVYGDMQDGNGNTPTEIRHAERFLGEVSSAVPVVGVEEAVERLTAQSLKSEAEHVGFRASGYVLVTQDDLRTILQALQGSSLRDPYRATEQPVVGWRPIETHDGSSEPVDVWAFWPETGRAERTADAEWVPEKGWKLGQYFAFQFMLPPKVTHWRPLPDSPSDSGEAALGGDEAEGGVHPNALSEDDRDALISKLAHEAADREAQLKAAYEALERAVADELGDDWRSVARQELARRGEGA